MSGNGATNLCALEELTHQPPKGLANAVSEGGHRFTSRRRDVGEICCVALMSLCVHCAAAT